ncbi:SCO2523 family variant P-loop protein [Phytohabitans flavus]|uniref:DNA-binding protein n=1 Tax=Phytohabitans flavus TaxID=1076124 RepID=A0A6F8XXD6_9ACTN|nr:SCO2523 family variant P-loop protein [Phytohabitans flavus]BCB78514.1 DNA-binding protein [Phytohabitans flavus]
MLIFATSDKGGTGRSVTSCNIGYRRSLLGSDTCYLDFDFGSPTAGTIFNVPDVGRGTTRGGLHSYLLGKVSDPHPVDIWTESDRASLRARPPGAGRLVLFPGDAGGSEFAADSDRVRRCVRLFLRLDEEFDVTLVDLSAGRSYATEIVLAATATPELRRVVSRWLVFHRWTRQHIIAAAGLVYGERGILDAGPAYGHDRERLADSIRFVRTAVVDPNSPELDGLRAAQVAWLRDCNRDLQELATAWRVGRTLLMGSVPLDPVLQWREQLISDNDVFARQIANRETVEAFETLAKKVTDDAAWEGL